MKRTICQFFYSTSSKSLWAFLSGKLLIQDDNPINQLIFGLVAAGVVLISDTHRTRQLLKILKANQKSRIGIQSLSHLGMKIYFKSYPKSGRCKKRTGEIKK